MAKPTLSTRPRKLSNKEQRELASLEAKIPELEAEKTEIETTLYRDPPQDFSQVQALSERLAILNDEIEVGTERWLELAELAS